MSDEQTPPPPALRLKPRLRPAEASPGASPPAAVPVLSAAGAESPPVVAPPQVEAPVVLVPPAVVIPPPPATETPVSVTPGEPVKFKFKPKAPPPVVAAPPSAEIPAVIPDASVPPPLPADPAPLPAPRPARDLMPMPVNGPKQGLYVTGNSVKTLPPFPAIPPARTGKTVPPLPLGTGKTVPPLPIRAGQTIAPFPVPHLNVQGAVIDDKDAAAGGASANRLRRPLTIVVTVMVLAGAVFFGWRRYGSKGQVATKPTASVPASATIPAPSPAKSSAAVPTPSDTLNQIAQVPINAINQAQDAIAARRAGEQSRVDAVTAGDDIPDRPARKASAPGAKSPAASSAPVTMTAVAPGLAASAPIESVSEASAEFRRFVANVKINGVFQGDPPRAMINGRLTRAGERIDAELGVIFVGVDAERHRLIFKDRTNATIQRKY